MNLATVLHCSLRCNCCSFALVPGGGSLRGNEIRKQLYCCYECRSRDVLATRETRRPTVTRSASATFSERRQGKCCHVICTTVNKIVLRFQYD